MTEPLRILAVEDDEADFWLMERLLKQQGIESACCRVDRFPDLEVQAGLGPWDVVLVDYTVPGLVFGEVLQLLKDRIPEVPIIVVSGTIGEERAVALMKDGVADFVLKDSPLRLASAIERSIREAGERAGRRMAESSLHVLEAAINSATHVVVITDRDGRVTWVNPAFTTVTGYTSDEAVGRSPGQLIKSGQHGREFYEEFWRTILAGQTWRGEMTNRRKDGSVYPEEQIITPVRNSQGEITHYVGIKRDLTEEKALQAKFAHAQKMESVGRLAAGIAHDFNNLITAINGAAELALLKVAGDDAVRADLEHIRMTAARAASLTRQLLAFAQRQIIAPEVLSLDQVVASLREMVSRLLGEDIGLVIVPSPEPTHVLADRGQIEQVLMNLVVNARDAMPGRGQLTITTTVQDAGEQSAGEVVLSVSDTGTGMSPEVQAQIFEPFFTTKEIGRGTGLGLATVLGIVTQCHGSTDVETAVGQGTTFRVRVPRIERRKAARVSAPEVTPAKAQGPPKGTETILVVEDDDFLRALARRMLAMGGYKVLDACSGEEALATLRATVDPVHLMLTDVVLPGISGTDLLNEMKEDGRVLKVLYTSGYNSEILDSAGTAGRKRHFLPKPYTMAQILEKVRQVLDDGENEAEVLVG